MSGRVNLIANTLTDVSTAVVKTGGDVTVAALEKGGNTVVSTFTFADNTMQLAVIASEGWLKDAQALEEIRADERAFNRLERAEALELKVSAHAAAKAS